MKEFILSVSLITIFSIIISCASIMQDSNYEYRKQIFTSYKEGAEKEYLNNEFTYNKNFTGYTSEFARKDEIISTLKSKEYWKCQSVLILEETIKDGYRTYPFNKGISVVLVSNDNLSLSINLSFFKELINNGCLVMSDKNFNYEGWEFIYQKNYDEFDKREVVKLRPTYRSVLRSPEKDKHNHLWGVPIIIKEEDKEPIYLFNIVYEADNWIFIHENNSLSVIADTLSFNFNTIKIDRDTFTDMLGTRARIIEKAYYELSKDQMKNIFFANTLKLKINSDKGYIKTVVPQRTKFYWRKFYESEIKRL